MRSDFLARIALVIALCTHHTYALPLLRADGQAEVLSNNPTRTNKDDVLNASARVQVGNLASASANARVAGGDAPLASVSAKVVLGDQDRRIQDEGQNAEKSFDANANRIKLARPQQKQQQARPDNSRSSGDDKVFNPNSNRKVGIPQREPAPLVDVNLGEKKDDGNLIKADPIARVGVPTGSDRDPDEQINEPARAVNNDRPKDSKPADKVFRPNGNQAKLARPQNNQQQREDSPSSGGHLLDLNLGQPKDSGNLLDLPGLAAVGLPSGGNDRPIENKKSDKVFRPDGNQTKLAQRPNQVEQAAPKNDPLVDLNLGNENDSGNLLDLPGLAAVGLPSGNSDPSTSTGPQQNNAPIKLAKSEPKEPSGSDKLIDLNLGQPKDSGNLLNLPGLLGVGLPSGNSDPSTKSKQEKPVSFSNSDRPQTPSDHLVDLNLGQPKDSGNLLNLPGLAAVGLPSGEAPPVDKALPKQNQQKLPQEPKDNAANLNGDRIKLARPVQRPDQTKDLPKVDGSKDRLVDLNLGEPKDDGNVLDLPGLAAVGLPSSSDSKKTDSKSDPIVDLHLGDKKGDKSDKVAEIPNVVRISAPHHDQHDKVHPSNGKQEHHSTHDPLEGATIRVGKMACIEIDGKQRCDKDGHHTGPSHQQQQDAHHADAKKQDHKPQQQHKKEQHKEADKKFQQDKSIKLAKPAQKHKEAEDHCPRGFYRDSITGSCEKDFSNGNAIRLHRGVKPNDKGACPIDYTMHPTLSLCFEVTLDWMMIDLGISGPHALINTGCETGHIAHPYLSDICIDARIRFDLDLGEGACRPDFKGVCGKGWRRHATIPNLCLDESLDIDLGNNRKGKKSSADKICRAGWRNHPDLIDICIDSSLDLALFNDDRCPTKSGQCSSGYKLHPILNDLCILEHMLVDLKYGQIAAAQHKKETNKVQESEHKPKKEYRYPPSRAVVELGPEERKPFISIGLGL